MFTTAGKDLALAGVTAACGYVGLITAITDWRAGTVTEASFTGYARKAITWGAAAATSGSDGRQQANSGAVTFDKNTGADQAIIAYGLYAASSGGTPKSIVLLDTDNPVVGFVTASTDLIGAPAHGLVADQRVFFMKEPIGQAPDVFAENTAYYVLATGLTANVFALSATSGGAAINATQDGLAMFIPYKSQTVASNSVVSFATGTIIEQI